MVALRLISSIEAMLLVEDQVPVRQAASTTSNHSLSARSSIVDMVSCPVGDGELDRVIASCLVFGYSCFSRRVIRYAVASLYRSEQFQRALGMEEVWESLPER